MCRVYGTKPDRYVRLCSKAARITKGERIPADDIRSITAFACNESRYRVLEQLGYHRPPKGITS